MVSEYQERRLSEALQALGRTATARQIWKWLSKQYKYPGFRNANSVAQALRVLKARNRLNK